MSGERTSPLDRRKAPASATQAVTGPVLKRRYCAPWTAARSRSDAREEQELRGIDGASAEHDLAIHMGDVLALALHIGDPDGAITLERPESNIWVPAQIAVHI